MNEQAERFIQETVLPELDKGRPGFDKQHTIAVVANMRDIIAHTPSLVPHTEVLTIAAYLHDWGYADLYQDGYPIPEYGSAAVKEFKRLHMEIGSRKAEKLLADAHFDYLSPEQKMRIVHLVLVHDKIDGSLVDEDELTLFEADTLGVLDVNRMTPTMDKETNEKWMVDCRNIRFSKFIHGYSKEKFEEYYALRTKWFENK
jgi:hypothetical protein